MIHHVGCWAVVRKLLWAKFAFHFFAIFLQKMLPHWRSLWHGVNYCSLELSKCSVAEVKHSSLHWVVSSKIYLNIIFIHKVLFLTQYSLSLKNKIGYIRSAYCVLPTLENNGLRSTFLLMKVTPAIVEQEHFEQPIDQSMRRCQPSCECMCCCSLTHCVNMCTVGGDLLFFASCCLHYRQISDLQYKTMQMSLL